MRRSSIALGLALLVTLVGCSEPIAGSTPVPSANVSPSRGSSSPPSTSPTAPRTSPTRSVVESTSASPSTSVKPTTTTPAPRPTTPRASASTSPVLTRPPSTSAAPPTTTATNYDAYSNADLSWWYRPPTPWDRDTPATIDPDVARLISGHDVIWRRQTSAKVVHLTMDEGYEFETNSTEILDIAAAKGVRITFFITGSFLRNNPDLVRRMLREGHQVANHTEKHLRASTALDTSTRTFINEIRNLERSYQSMMGRPITRLYRPPEGGYSQRSLKIADDLGYTTVFWSFAYADWDTAKQPDPTAAKNKILGELHPGSVILLHAVSDTNVAILGDVIDGIRARGYAITLLDA